MNIIVTGASKGLGFATVKAFAEDTDHQIIAVSRNRKLLDQLKNECLEKNPQAKVFPLALDLVSSDLLMELLPFVRQHFQSLDILINNAGLLINEPVTELSDADFDRIFDTNVKTVFKLVRDLKPVFSKGSHIVNISSMGGFQGSVKFPGLSLYSASKGALAVFTECLAEELKAFGISVNCLAIGAVQTEMLQEAFPGYKAPLNPDQMAGYLKEFAQTGHHYFNGKILPVSLSTP
ncbi:MAG: SDR family oxidoreductase [Bacteroidales bacterium]|nr:SDR family oxidoreductase [Bacteroidales bacterium]